MLKVTVNDKKEYAVSFDPDSPSKGTINGKKFEWDVTKTKETGFHVLMDHKSYNVSIVKADAGEKKMVLEVNGQKYHLSIKDKYDELLRRLGMDNLNSNKISEVKAPMPGLVLDIMVTEGSAVKKGDSLIVLEAMKMENILKSPSDGIVKKVIVKKGIAVEKNQVLINFS